MTLKDNAAVRFTWKYLEILGHTSIVDISGRIVSNNGFQWFELEMQGCFRRYIRIGFLFVPFFLLLSCQYLTTDSVLFDFNSDSSDFPRSRLRLISRLLFWLARAMNVEESKKQKIARKKTEGAKLSFRSSWQSRSSRRCQADHLHLCQLPDSIFRY